jgi:hypothetical protein
MLQMQTEVWNPLIPDLMHRLEPQQLLSFLVTILLLLLAVMIAVAVWSRSHRLRRRGRELDDQQWKEILLQRFAELEKEISKSD